MTLRKQVKNLTILLYILQRSRIQFDVNVALLLFGKLEIDATMCGVLWIHILEFFASSSGFVA